MGNHWYIDLPHSDPRPLKMCSSVERYFNKLNPEGYIIDNIYLLEQGDSVVLDGLIEIKDNDLSKIFLSNDEFNMEIFIDNHPITISSSLYTLLEKRYKLDLHLNIYRLIIDETKIYYET